MDIRVEKRDYDSGLEELQAEWDALLKRSTWPSIYSTFDYVQTACRHFKREEDVSFFLLMRHGERGELLAIFPLSLWSHDHHGVNRRVVAHGITTSFTDVDKPYPLVDRNHEKACWDRFARYFRNDFTRWDLIDFDSTVSDAYFSKSLRSLFPSPRYRAKSMPGPEYPLLRLDGEWEQFWSAHRKVRRKTRRIEKVIGDQLSHVITNDPADVDRCLAEYIATEELSWKAGQGVSEPESQEFYRELLPKLAAKGQVYFGMMYDGETVMSAAIAYVFDTHLYFALWTYNPAYAYLSAGSVNGTRMLEYFHGKGLTEADYLSGCADYMYPLADRVEQTCDIIIHRFGWRNGLVSLKYTCRKLSLLFRRARNRLKRKFAPHKKKTSSVRHALGIEIEKVYWSPGLSSLAEEWDELLQRSSQPTLYSSFDYVYTSCSHFKDKETIVFLLFRSMDTRRLLAIFPISMWNEKVYGLDIKTITHGITTSNTDVDKPYPIIDRDHEKMCWTRFRNYFRYEYRKWDLIEYDELFPESYLSQSLTDLFRFPFFWTKVKPGPDSPIVQLDGDWDRFWQSHNNLRKKDRRLVNKIGDSFSYRVTGDPADVERCLKEYIATELSSWKAGEGVSREGNPEFYAELLPKLAEKGQLFFGMMYDGDTVISAEISYAYKDRVYFALGTYNPAYSKLSPGAVSTGRFMQYFYDKGYVDGDFLAGFAHYINPWASRIQNTKNTVIRRMGWKSWYLAGRHLLKKVKAKVKRIIASKTPHPAEAEQPVADA